MNGDPRSVERHILPDIKSDENIKLKTIILYTIINTGVLISP